MAFTAIIYHVWGERNMRMFEGKQHSFEDIVNSIVKEIQYTIEE